MLTLLFRDEEKETMRSALSLKDPLPQRWRQGLHPSSHGRSTCSEPLGREVTPSISHRVCVRDLVVWTEAAMMCISCTTPSVLPPSPAAPRDKCLH